MNNAYKKQITTIKDNKLSNDIRLQIRNRMQAMDLNIRALERKAGLNIGAVTNILHGTSANPTAETLIALSNAFNCSIDDLLNRTTKTPQDTTFTQHFQPFQWNSTLFLSIVSELDKQLNNRGIPISSDRALNLIHEVYLYNLKKNKEIVEESLVEWLLDKSL